MKTNVLRVDVFVLSGFIASLFTGFLNPLYVSMILARLDPRVIALGSFMASGFPVIVGAAMGNRGVFRRLQAALPAVMGGELALAAGTVLLAIVDLRAYYLASMLILGVFSSSVIYLLQKVKEARYRRGRAAFDRRSEMADGLGLVAGSGLSVVGVAFLQTPLAVAALGALQTAVVYSLFLILHRRVSPRRATASPRRATASPRRATASPRRATASPRRATASLKRVGPAEEEPHPRRTVPEGLPVAA